MLFKPLFHSGLLTSHWLRQILGPSRVRRNITRYLAKDENLEIYEELEPLMQPINLRGCYGYLVYSVVTFIVGLERWVDCHETEEQASMCEA